MATHDSNTIIKFADDTTVVGLINDDNETAYREEVRDQGNNLSLNASKANELEVDYRKQRAPFHIDGAVEEKVEIFKFLGVHITNELTWSTHTHPHTSEEDTSEPLPPQEAEKKLHSCTIESILTGCITAWYGNYKGTRPQGATEDGEYGPVHHWGRAPCHPRPLLQAE
jgi:hypothetical protein